MTTGLPTITYVFRLYVTSQTALSVQAEARLRSLCEDQIPGLYELEIIDVSEHPELAETDKIVVIPTVVRLAPIPQRRVIGDFSDDIRTAAALGLPDPYQVALERGQR